MGVSPFIRIRGLKKSFDRQTVLSCVDLDLPHGNNVVLLGVSGSGKTVLMKCLLGLITPDVGSIEIDGQETVGISQRDRSVLMKKVGVLFQNGALFDSLAVWQNVAFVSLNARQTAPRKAREIAVDMLARVGLGSDAADLRPAELSGGMQKRVALARAFAGDPEVLLLDSPTAGLDPILTAIIDSLIVASLGRLGATALTITQDIESARRTAQRAALLSEGRIAWDGPITAIDTSGNPEVARFIAASR
jgi:phospholipid/cholesterol/gamma-HCH transport system ATP-binding protein